MADALSRVSAGLFSAAQRSAGGLLPYNGHTHSSIGRLMATTSTSIGSPSRQ